MNRTLTGTVVSNKMDKTVAVAVNKVRTHTLYRKQYKVTKKFLAHDERNTCMTGDVVVIAETKPRSSRKRWVVKSVLKKSEAA